METLNPKTCSMAHSMRVLLCNNGRLQLARQLICVECIYILLASWVQHQTEGEEGVLEVKTLPKLAKKGITLEEYICDNERLQGCPLYRKNGNYSLKNTHQHYHQIQMYLTGRKFCTIVYWIPAHMLYFDVPFDKTWSETNIQKLMNFYKTEIFDKSAKSIIWFPTFH